jgi:hypothetical protein
MGAEDVVLDAVADLKRSVIEESKSVITAPALPVTVTSGEQQNAYQNFLHYLVLTSVSKKEFNAAVRVYLPTLEAAGLTKDSELVKTLKEQLQSAWDEDAV